MKKLIIFLLIGFIGYSQERTAFSIVQDVKLAFVEDNYNNSPYTADVLFKVQRELRQGSGGFGVLYAQIEAADLSGGFYTRSALGFGISFNKFLDNFTVTPSVNFGMINRWSSNYFSGEVQAEVTYRLLKHLSVVGLYSATNREDIGLWRSNVYAGIKIDLPSGAKSCYPF